MNSISDMPSIYARRKRGEIYEHFPVFNRNVDFGIKLRRKIYGRGGFMDGKYFPPFPFASKKPATRVEKAF
jgi:hypothetical protein